MKSHKNEHAFVKQNSFIRYNTKALLKLTYDASFAGVGVARSHILPKQKGRPKEYGSLVLTTAERKHLQLNREALGLMF